MNESLKLKPDKQWEEAGASALRRGRWGGCLFWLLLTAGIFVAVLGLGFPVGDEAGEASLFFIMVILYFPAIWLYKRLFKRVEPDRFKARMELRGSRFSVRLPSLRDRWVHFELNESLTVRCGSKHAYKRDSGPTVLLLSQENHAVVFESRGVVKDWPGELVVESSLIEYNWRFTPSIAVHHETLIDILHALDQQLAQGCLPGSHPNHLA
jgi:hypothetical protein